MAPQAETDRLNQRFWDELCGSTLARAAGVEDSSPASLRRFDAAYLAYYPYLRHYLPAPAPHSRVLEIGLGYGTLSQLLAERVGDYRGLDIAAGPVAMVRHRLSDLGIPDADDRVVQGSALAIPHPDASFEYVYTIGCLHHTGDLPRAVAEIRRVLAPGGQLTVMLYNRHSARQLLVRARARAQGRPRGGEELRRRYDVNTAGEAAPVTEFVSAREAKQLFGWCSELRVDRQNFDSYAPHLLRGRVRLLTLPREKLLGTVARVAGLDLYIVGRR